MDYPTENDGLARCFAFFTFECRKAITARQGGNIVERFQQYGVLSLALQPFMGAYRIDINVEHATYTAAHPPMRGAMVSFSVEIQVRRVWNVRASWQNPTRYTWYCDWNNNEDHRSRDVGWCEQSWMFDTPLRVIWVMRTWVGDLHCWMGLL